MKLLTLVAVLALSVSCQTKQSAKQPANAKVSSAEDRYHAAQEKIFEQHSKELADAGRIPTGYDAYEYMSQYGWHTSKASSVGPNPPLWLLQTGGDDGSFGAYTFFAPAFEQAKKMWIFDGFMLPGSDLLWIKNSNIAFDKSVIGRTIPRLTLAGCYADNGNDPCEAEFKNPDFSAGLLGKVPGELRDAKVIDVFGHSFEYGPGRGPEYWAGPLRLNKKATAFLVMHGIELLPPGYVDMCACKMSTTSQQTTEKPCVPFRKGMTKEAGACVSVVIP